MKPKSKFYPLHNRGNHIETFFSLVSTEFRALKNDKNNSKISNLTQQEKRALKALTENSDIIIRSADKGGSIVIQDIDDYIREAHHILHDTNYYLILLEDPSSVYYIDYTQLIKKAFETKIINKKELEFLTPQNPIMPIYYHLPKVHKSITNPPGRPIISGIGSLACPLSEYIDHFLQKYVVDLDSYLKDSASLISLIKPLEWQQDFWWASLDVTALYTNIRHNLGLTSIKGFLDKDPEMPNRQKNFILEHIKFILTHNIFKFEDTIYHQSCGTAMGTKFAPSYANLFMGAFEKNMIIGSNWQNHIVIYRRYIDDLFFVWKGDESDFEKFVNHLNENDWGLSFTGNISKTQLEYLDIDLNVSDNHVTTKTFFLKRGL